MNKDCFWHPDMIGILTAAAVHTSNRYGGDVDELINVGWFYQGRHCKDLVQAKKYLFLNAKRQMRKYVLDQQTKKSNDRKISTVVAEMYGKSI